MLVNAHPLMAPPLRGTYTAMSAYAALLKGTPLVADLSERDMVVIRPRRLAVPMQPGDGQSAAPPETVVITGRAGVEERTWTDISYSLDIVPQERLRQSGVSSVADSIRTIPGFWVEDSGGEASANARARGIPVDGFASVQVAEDGLPIQHDPALGFLNADQSFRLDETISQVQVVRGGPASVLSSNAPGGPFSGGTSGCPCSTHSDCQKSQTMTNDKFKLRSTEKLHT